MQQKRSSPVDFEFFGKAEVGKAHQPKRSRVIIRICLACLAFVTGQLSTAAADSILHLAMLKADSAERRTVFRAVPPTSTRELKAANAIQNPVINLRLDRNEEVFSFKTLLLKKRPEREARNPLKLTRHSAREKADARLWASASIQAGYGEIYPDKSPGVYGRNPTGWQEPGCGYVKILFRF